MSESEYRSAREAARARIAVLEAELRDLDAIDAPDAPPSMYAEEKAQLGARLKQLQRGRDLPLFVAIVIVVSIAKLSLVHGSAVPGLIWWVGVAALTVRSMMHYRNPLREEHKLELRLRQIIAIEDSEDAKFRAKTAKIRVGIDDEITERERLEVELAEARVLAEDHEQKKI